MYSFRLTLLFDIIPLLESFNTAGGVHHAAFAGEERVTVAANFNLEFFFRRTGGEGVAARANHYGIVIILRMNLFFHFNYCKR